MSRHRSASVVISLLALCLSACAGESETGATPYGSGAGAAAPPVVGTFEMGGTLQEFRVTKCDLTGTAEDGIFLRGTGTMPDGQALTPDGGSLFVVVERLTHRSGMVRERAEVRFGGFEAEDGWEATSTSSTIIQISGNDLVVAATYGHASRDETVEGTLKVTCPALTYP